MGPGPFSFLEAHTRFPGRSTDRVLVVAAHPDDEAIGIGGHLPSLVDPWVLYVTDGAPRNPAFAAATGNTVSGYAETRRAEARAALALAGIPEDRICKAGIRDQEASQNLPGLISTLAAILQKIAPSVVVTHSYEGGHPDHDATAFAVWAASVLLQREGITPPRIVEFTSYHNSADGIRVGDFVHSDGCAVLTVQLSVAQREIKRRMFQSYESQSKVLQAFPIGIERFRQAPSYDFTEPPHPGKLYYENFDWGMTGKEWRSLAAAALEQLDLISW